MSAAQPGIRGSIPKILRMDSVCVEGEDLRGERSSSVSPCSAGQAARTRVKGQERSDAFTQPPATLLWMHLALNTAGGGRGH